MKKIKKTLKIKFLIVLFLSLSFVAFSRAVCLKKFTFNEDEALDKWKKVVLNGEVDYKLTKYGDEGYIHAVSEKTCSALYYRIGFKLREYPILRWKWRVLQFPDKSKALTDEEKDDYAARVYVVFPFLSFASSKFLEYVWSEDTPAETITDSPSGNNVKIIVARSGKTSNGEWVIETRNVYQDYITAFGKRPHRAGAIAIMCDADSTKTSAASAFDDITIESQPLP